MEEARHSGQVWSAKLRIPIFDPKGWPSVDDFNHTLINKDEFCLRASNSVIKIDKELSRRSAAELRKKYQKEPAIYDKTKKSKL